MPQIFIEGEYVGGSDQLREKFGITDKADAKPAEADEYTDMTPAEVAKRYWGDAGDASQAIAG
ncbi:MAG: hypothetical protein AAGJ50_14305, partial [Pseudomonadota bacterium]